MISPSRKSAVPAPVPERQHHLHALAFDRAETLDIGIVEHANRLAQMLGEHRLQIETRQRVGAEIGRGDDPSRRGHNRESRPTPARRCRAALPTWSMARTRSSGATGFGGVGTRCRSPTKLPASSSNAALIPVPPMSIASVRGSFITRLSLRTQRAHGGSPQRSLGFQVRLDVHSGQAYFCPILSPGAAERGGAGCELRRP